MELTSWMKMARFQTFWIQMRKNEPLDESCKTGQTTRRKMAFYSGFYYENSNTYVYNIPANIESQTPVSSILIKIIIGQRFIH
ncbi:hypothetical protein Hanom_Chr03g00235751 [Helianthus anomalus]